MHTHIFGKICMHILVMVRMVDSVFVFVIDVYWVFPFVFKYYWMPNTSVLKWQIIEILHGQNNIVNFLGFIKYGMLPSTEHL